MQENDTNYPSDETLDDASLQDNEEPQEAFADDKSTGEGPDLVQEPLGEDESATNSEADHSHDLDDQQEANAFEDDETDSPTP